jgi:hypothetical protein
MCNRGVAARQPGVAEACSAASSAGLSQAFLTQLSVCFVASGLVFLLAGWRVRADIDPAKA